MAGKVEIYGFETSNNLKVRVALGYKGIPYEFHRIDPTDRGEIIRRSGQFLTPIMVHGDTVLFDSAAILRYLDANFPAAPKLYGRDRDEQWAIEDWERFGRSDLAAGMMKVVHSRAAGGGDGPELRAEAAKLYESAVDEVAARMRGRRWLVGDALSAADVTCAAVMFRIGQSGVLPQPEAVSELTGWVERVMAHDRIGASGS
jgi:glutathione S-transferase